MSSEFIEGQAKGRIAENFIKTVLALSGYKVMDFGIENYNQEVIKLITTNYDSDSNKRLLSMPDFVVVDENTKESWLVEAKFRNLKEPFEYNKTEIPFKYSTMKRYLDYWKDATLVIVFNQTPFCICIDLKDVNWNVHFKGKFENKEGNLDELWNFSPNYQIINRKFPKVTEDKFKQALQLVGLK